MTPLRYPLAAAALLLCACTRPADTPQPPATAPIYQPSTPAEKLAYLDSPSTARPSDATLAQYSAALATLGQQYEGSPQEISNIVSKVQGALEKDGCPPRTMLKIMRDMDQRQAPSIRVPFKEAAAMYIVVTGQPGCRR